MAKYKGTKTLEVLEGADNYNKWIADSISPYITSPALEVGAGTGNISEYFLNLNNLVLTDNDPKLVELLNNKFGGRKNISVETFDISKQLHSIKNRFKTIYSVNVLEHIRDDDRAFANIYSLLARGGSMVALVPAKKMAFTKLDKSLGHYRRYEKRQLVEKLENAHFKVELIEYFNVLGLLSWMIRDKISRNHSELKHSQVQLFDSIVPFLKAIEPKRNLPFGISLIVVAVKK